MHPADVPNADRAWTSRSQGSRLGHRVFMALISIAARRPAYLLLRMVALWYLLRDRKTTSALRHFHAQLGTSTGLLNIYTHIYSFGESLIDGYAFLSRRTPPFIFSYDGEEHITAALARGKGLILLTAHIGNGEIAANLLRDRITTPVNVIMLDENSDEMRRVLRRATDQRRISIIPVTPDPLALMIQVRSALARNEILVVVGDRVSGSEATRTLPFLGRAARFPVGPFVFSSLTGAPLIAAFCIKSGNDRYHLRVSGMIEIGQHDRSHRDRALGEAMRGYVDILEEEVRAHPYQWFNLYEYWQ